MTPATEVREPVARPRSEHRRTGPVRAPSPDRAEPTVAIVHDYLTQRGGAERVVLSMHDVFPEATVHTALYEPSGTFPEFADLDVVTAPLDRIGPLRRRHRLALPFLASTFSAMAVDADVVLCSSSGWAHGVQATGRKVVYSSSAAQSAASELKLRGSIAGLDPDTALGAVLSTTQLHRYQTKDELIGIALAAD
jgi:hypothetical protein